MLGKLSPNDESRERYTLTHLHAKGGMGRVWLARDGALGRQIALKELRPDQADNSIVCSRFLYEAKITAQLEHPGIVPVYELGEGDAPYYTMRFVRGRTLSEAIRAYHKKRAAGEADSVARVELLTAFVNVCHAVAYAHSRGIIHRDLKGQNVVLGDFGEVMVLDWGLAKRVGPDQQEGGDSHEQEFALDPAPGPAAAPDLDGGDNAAAAHLNGSSGSGQDDGMTLPESQDRRSDPAPAPTPVPTAAPRTMLIPMPTGTPAIVRVPALARAAIRIASRAPARKGPCRGSSWGPRLTWLPSKPRGVMTWSTNEPTSMAWARSSSRF